MLMRTWLIANSAVLVINSIVAHAQIVAVQTPDLTSGGGPLAWPGYTVGWDFTVNNTAISVSQLGYFDPLGNGLFDSHPVGLWDSSGTLVAQATVPSGTAATLAHSYRFVTLDSPVTLNANQSYFIGALNPTASDTLIQQTTAIIASEITYNTPRYALSTELAWPQSSFSAVSQGLFGPNMVFTPVPEPQEYALMAGLGLCAFFVVRKLRPGSRREA
jgi:hypothetical protein